MASGFLPVTLSSYARRPTAWADIDEPTWQSWTWQHQNRIRSLAALEPLLSLTASERLAIGLTADAFRLGITPHYLALIDQENPRCPIRAQSIPTLGETLVFPFELEDPLAEEAHMPVPGITHRYPDRVLLYASHHCPVYCRHCTRKRKVSFPESAPTRDAIDDGLVYIQEHPEIRDVLVSGGDPLTLSTARLDHILGRLRQIDHLDVVRLGTRNPVTLPQRIDSPLLEILARHAPIYLNTHFNHPNEASAEAEAALKGLREAGCILGNQMVLLAGVNDDGPTVERLNRWLLRHGCRPYYILQADMAQGITHFRTPLSRGLEIMRHLRGRLSGLGVPQFVIDLPGGGGKIPLAPTYLSHSDGDTLTFQNWRGDPFTFVDIDGPSAVDAILRSQQDP